MPESIQKILSGFLAGILAALVFHQTALFILKLAGVLPDAQPWSLAASLHPLVPELAVTCIWGGFWGAIIALAWADIPGDSIAVRGAAAGLIGPGIIGTWTVVPWLGGHPMFAGGDVKQIATTAIMLISYGVGAALFRCLFEKKRVQQPTRRRVLI